VRRPHGHDACPCGGGLFRDCCEPVLDGVRLPETAEELMRSRYTAYAVGHADHVFRTWHPRTRPDRPPVDEDVSWAGLQILRTEEGGPADENGVVEFIARNSGPLGRGELHEVSRFARRAGRWFYVDGDLV
jgi:SEC-C motif-containing protein